MHHSNTVAGNDNIFFGGDRVPIEFFFLVP